MSKESGIVILGIFVAALPFLGFPESWRVIMYVMSGLGTMLLGFMVRADHLHHDSISSTQQMDTLRLQSAHTKKISDIAVPEMPAEMPSAE